jgi:hypothetical protein
MDKNDQNSFKVKYFDYQEDIYNLDCKLTLSANKADHNLIY